MSFLRGLKKLEKFLDAVAENLSEYPAAEQQGAINSGGSQHHVQSSYRTSNSRSAEPSHVVLGGYNPAKHSIDLRPPADTSMPSLVQYYTNMLSSAREEIKSCLPSIAEDQLETFFSSVQQEAQARVFVQDAQRRLDQAIHGKKQQEIDSATQNLNHAQILLKEAQAATMQVSRPVLDHIHVQLSQRSNQLDLTLMQCTILIDATPQRLAQYASQGGHHFQQVQSLLQSPALMKSILEANGPKNNNYLETLRIFHCIINESSNVAPSNHIGGHTILHRLALATALEFAAPVLIFDTRTPVDPIRRYFHYEAAYLEGSLDPLFSSLSVLELRMVVNNDASDGEITWCRGMLRNYRPDFTLLDDYHWKYCMIVKSDVRYKRPEWTSSPKTYQQLLSGGGMCGPRAWFGRFACKSFGIPTWGVRQPGHAAMSHWMPASSAGEWTICLGGPNWQKSFWEDINGEHFATEMKARAGGATGSYDRVLRLLWLADICGEAKVGSQSPAYYKRNVRARLWSELAWMQQCILAQCRSEASLGYNSTTCVDRLCILTLEEQIRRSNASRNDCKFHLDSRSGVITIPASSCSKPTSNTQKVLFMKSFLREEGNGMQVHLRGDGCLEYAVTLPNNAGTGKYAVSLRVVNVSADSKPLRLTVKRGSSHDCVYSVVVPYTRGEWQCTPTSLIELDVRGTNLFSVGRVEADALGLSIMDIILKPM